MARKALIHKNTNLTTNNGGVISPKLPAVGTLLKGEIAVNYKNGYETLSIENDLGEVVPFASLEQIMSYVDNSLPNLELSSNYSTSDLENEDLQLAGGDSYEEAFSKLEKSINDNEQITAAALTDLDSRINTLHLPQSLDDIPDGSTRKLSDYATTTLLATKQDALVSGTNIKTINNQSLLGSGNITIQGGSGGDTNVIETIKVNGTALTPDSNKAVDITVPEQITSSEFVGSMNRSDVAGSGNLSIRNTSGTFPTLPAGSYVVKTYASSKTTDYTLSISFGGQTYSLTSSNGVIDDSRTLVFTANATWSGSITTVNSSTILSVRVYTLGTAVTTVGSVAVSNDYNDLDNKPTIPSAVTESTVTGWGFTKNAGTVTGVKMNGTTNNPTNGVVDLGTVLTTETDPTVPAWAKAASKPTYTASEVGALPDTYTPPVTSVNGQTGAVNLTIPAAPGTLNTTATTAQSTSSSEALSGNITLHKVAKTGTYNDLIGKPTIPAAQVQSDWNATSGMGVILNKPTIPTVNNATLTIQKNGTTVNTFTANASSNVTANIQVNELPTVSSSDNGKILQVVNGAWSLVTPVTVYTGTSTPNSSLGINGDLYVLTS